MSETFTRKQVHAAVTKARQDFTFAGEVLLDRLKQENEDLQRQLAEKDETIKEAVEIQFRCYTAVHVLKTMLKKARLGGGANVAAELMSDLATANPEFPSRSSLRTSITGGETDG